MSRNFNLEAELKQAAMAAGAMESALADFELDVQGYRITSRSEIEAWVQKAKELYPHRWASQGAEDDALCRSAFVAKNLTDAGRLYKQVGEARFEELKKQWASGEPDHIKKKNGSVDHSRNPWAPTEKNINMKTGRYTSEAFARQCSLTRANERAAAQVAASVGAKLGDTTAPGFKRVA